MGLLDILLALGRALCGGSPATEEPPIEYQRPHAERPPRPPVIITQPAPIEYQRPYAERPPRPQAIITQPAGRVAPEYQRPEPKPKPKFQVDQQHRKPRQARSPAPVLQPERDASPDQTQVNQHEHYLALRAKANAEGDLMAQSFQRSHEVYDAGDRALAKQLSEKGKKHERTMESLNAQASAWIFRENNSNCKRGEVDLHGLYVKEAVAYVEKSIQEARERGDAEIRFIVGKGLHSDGNVAKIKPAVEDLMNKYNIPTEVDPRNGGVLIARLS